MPGGGRLSSRPMRIETLRQRLRALQAQPVHEQRILRLWAQALPHRIVAEFDGVRVLVVHDKADADTDAAGADVVITGHSHKPNIVRESGVLFLNPGSAGPRRFRLPVSLAFLEIENGKATARLQVLEVD